MTKMHFEAAAKMVREAQHMTIEERKVIAAAFARLFSEFNPRFDVGRFLDACELPR